MSAGEALQEAVLGALAAIDGLGLYDGAPLQAVAPHAVVEIGPETDWGHKSGAGRELRLAVVLRDEGERAVRLRGLMAEVEAIVLGLGTGLEGWRVISLRLARAMATRERSGWVGLVEFRARLLAD